MDLRRRLNFLLWTLVVVEVARCRTITHHKISTNVNGEKSTKSWTSVEDDDAHMDAADDLLKPNEIESTMPQHFDTKKITKLTGLPQEELLKQAALATHMDPIAVNELLKTKKPVITSTTDDQGVTRTTTYKLNADGSISSSTDIETPPISVEKSHKALQDIYSRHNEPETESIVGRVPLRSTPTQFNNFKFDANNWPQFDNSNFVRRPLLPASWNPNSWTAHQGPFPDTTPPTQAKPFDSSPTTNFFQPIESSNEPGTVTKTFQDDKGRTVTHTYSAGPTQWTQRSYTYPSTKWYSFDDKLKHAIETTTQQTSTPHTSTTTTTPFTTIKFEDVPIMDIWKDGKPVDDRVWGTLPAHLRPIDAGKRITTFKTEDIPMNPSFETKNVRTYTKQVQTDALPTIADLDPMMQEILKNAGIRPDDIESADGDTITKTRTEPDGKTITTTYRVNKVPKEQREFGWKPAYDFPTQQHHFNTDGMDFGKFPAFPQLPRRIFDTNDSGFGAPKSHTIEPTTTETTDVRTTTPRSETLGLIEAFLAKLSLTPAELLATNGEWSKTILDHDGRVLTAHLVLSTTKDAASKHVQPEPIK